MNEEKVHTHYDNLKVTRSAPAEVIKAAYRAMAQKYHPDINKSPGAERVMKIVNEAWEVLSDPVERQKHDRWIEEEERRISIARSTPKENAPRATEATQPPRKEPPSSTSPAQQQSETASVVDKGARNILLGTLVLSVALYFFTGSESKNHEKTSPTISPVSTFSPAPQPISQSVSAETDLPIGRAPWLANPEPSVVPESSENRRLRIARLAPGQQLPESSAYIVGSAYLAASGYSKLIIDNTANQSDVVVKVCRATSEACNAVRHAFVRVGDTFTFENMTAGKYDIRYVSLESDDISKSEAFDLEEISQDGGVRFSVLTMTLYTVASGNTQMASIDESQF